MKKFVFELQSVLEIKEKLESQAKNNFASAQAKLNEEEALRDEIGQKRENYRGQLTDSINGRLDLREISRLQDAIDILTERYMDQELVCKRAEKQVELARARLTTAIRERKTIEKLREKKLEEYMKEYNAEESKLIDELVSYKHSKA